MVSALETPDGRTFVYCVYAVGTEFVKIGIANDIRERLRGLQTGCPYKLELVAFKGYERRNDAIETESSLHLYFMDSSVHGEWFKHSDGSVKFIEAFADIEHVIRQAKQYLESRRKVRREPSYIDKWKRGH